MGKTRVPGSQPVRWVLVDDLSIDPAVQQPLNERLAGEIASAFDPDAFGHPAISHRADDHKGECEAADGDLVVLDGQTRSHALRLMGWNGQRIPCQVWHGLTKAEEAALFIKLNYQRTPRFINKFLVRITAKDPVACSINAIVMSAGYVIDREHRDGVITAAKALEDIYIGRGQKIKGDNPVALRDTLHVVTKAWGRTTDATNGKVLTGVGSVFLRYGEAADRERLAKRLSGVPGVDALIARGAGKRELHGGTISAGIAHYLVDEYNRGLRGKSRLPGWRETS